MGLAEIEHCDSETFLEEVLGVVRAGPSEAARDGFDGIVGGGEQTLEFPQPCIEYCVEERNAAYFPEPQIHERTRHFEVFHDVLRPDAALCVALNEGDCLLHERTSGRLPGC